MTRVLVAFGSKRGGTAGLAEMIGEALTEAGHLAVVTAAGDVRDVTEYDAVIVAGALYANRWHGDARRFVRRHRAALRDVPVWLVSSGPLDDSASQGDIGPTKQVARIGAGLGARGYATFGGSLAPDAKGLLAAAMARSHAGDWRDREHVRRWVREHFVEAQGRPTR